MVIADVENFAPLNYSEPPISFCRAGLLFLLQVFAGVMTAHNFLGLNYLLGVNVSEYFSLAAARGWHLQLALLWVSACWIGGSIFVISTVTKSTPPGQVQLVNLLFWLLVFMVTGSLIGVVLGPLGVLGEWWNFLGNQGWEFVEMGVMAKPLMLVLCCGDYSLA